MRSVVTPRHELDRVLRGRAARSAPGSCSCAFGLPMTTRCGVGALGADLRQRLEQRREALHRHVGARRRHEPAGHARDVGQRPEDRRVDADRHDVQPVGGHAHLGDDVAPARLRHGDEPRDLRARRASACRGTPYQRRSVSRRYARRGVREVEVAVDGDRVVQRGTAPASRRRASSRAGRVPRHWLSWTRSKSARRCCRSRRTRRLNVYGSGNPAAHMMRELAAGRSWSGTPTATAPGTGCSAGRGRGSGPSRAAAGRRARGTAGPENTVTSWPSSVSSRAR